MKNKSSATTKKAIAAAIVSHAFWGLSFMASRVGLDSAPVILLLSHRFLLAFLLMSLLRLTALGDCRLRGKPLLPLLLLGLFEPVVYFFGEQYGILHSSTIFSGVMIALIPIASTLAAIPILGEKPTLRQGLYSLLSVGGVIGIGLLTKSGGHLDWIGVAGLLVAVFSAVAYTLLNRGISARYSPFQLRAHGAFGRPRNGVRQPYDRGFGLRGRGAPARALFIYGARVLRDDPFRHLRRPACGQTGTNEGRGGEK